MSGQVTEQWPQHPLIDFVEHKSGDSKIIKGKQSKIPRLDLVQGYSASGPDVWVSVAKYNQPGVVISAVGARCGKAFLAQGEWTPIANTHALIPGPEVNVRWLWYLTNNEDFWIRGGSAQPFIKVKATLMRPVAIPPLEEQQRIVSILDEAFENIDDFSQKTLTKVTQLADHKKNSLKIIFNEAFEDGKNIQLGQICEVKDGTHDSPKYVEFGIPFVTQKNIKQSRLSLEKTKKISEEDHNKFYKRSNVGKNDILISMIGANRGECCIVDVDDIFSIKNVGLIKSSEEISNKYLLYYLMSPISQKYILENSSGSAQGFIGLRKLREFPIPFIPQEKQEYVVEKLDLAFSEIEKLERIFKMEFTNISELKRSILQEAFNGTL